MAARLLKPKERVVVACTRNLQWLSSNLRTFSSQGSNNSNETTAPPDVKDIKEPIHTWLDAKTGIFGPSDQRLPLPGNIGLGQILDPSRTSQASSIEFKSPLTTSGPPPDVFTVVTNHEKQMTTLNQQVDIEKGKGLEVLNVTNMPHVLECLIQECPDLVKKDFCSLFPGRELRDAPLSVVTLSQKTNNDMSGWSEEMESEREELLECFVHVAEEICAKLKSEGYWADFIDPSSGRPYYGRYTNATLFETDERYRHLGFRIEDLGCCKVISHRLWGTHVFVGAIFTNAPVNSEVLEEVVDVYNRDQPETDSE